MTTHGDPTPSEHLCNLRCGLTWPVEYLLIAESDRPPAVDRGIQIAFDVVVPGGRRVVEQPAIELYHQPLPVLDVAVSNTGRRRRPVLTTASG